MTNLFDLSSIKTLFNLKCHERRLSVTVIMFLKCLIEMLEVDNTCSKQLRVCLVNRSTVAEYEHDGRSETVPHLVHDKKCSFWKNLHCFGIRKNRVNQFLDS